jgi:hypothetical protein
MANEENLKSWKPGQSGNPNGRPRKTISSVNKELEERGVTVTSTNDIKDCFLRLINLSTDELESICDDDKQPAMIVIVAEAILSGKGFDVIEKILDRAIGKAEQKTDITTAGEKLNITISRANGTESE